MAGRRTGSGRGRGRARGAAPAARAGRRRGRRRGGRARQSRRHLRLRPAARRRRGRRAASSGQARPAGRAGGARGRPGEGGRACPSRIEPPGTVDGGDTLWLDRVTLLVGRGYRTNARVEQLARVPRRTGALVRPAALERAGEVAPDEPHLAARRRPRSRLSAACSRAAAGAAARVGSRPSRFRTRSSRRWARTCLRPRRALALEGNDETRRRMEAAGVEVVTYRGR